MGKDFWLHALAYFIGIRKTTLRGIFFYKRRQEFSLAVLSTFRVAIKKRVYCCSVWGLGATVWAPPPYTSEFFPFEKFLFERWLYAISPGCPRTKGFEIWVTPAGKPLFKTKISWLRFILRILGNQETQKTVFWVPFVNFGNYRLV